MPVLIPEEEDLRSRILAHLRARPGNQLVSAVWQGYLASLLEWGVISADMSSRLSDLLSKTGALEMVEIMLGPDYVDEHPELRSQITGTVGG